MSQLNLHHDNSQSISLSSKVSSDPPFSIDSIILRIKMMYDPMTLITQEEDLIEWCDALNFFARLAAYISILGEFS